MKISVLGLGYVGAISCACFANEGHFVIGVDVNQSKVDLINRGRSPIIEADLEKLIEEGVSKKRIIATTHIKTAIMESDITIICVGTPSLKNGNIDLNFIFKVCSEIGGIIKDKDSFHSIVIRSTIVPGTIRECVAQIEKASGKRHLKNFGVGSNPEFLREGTAVNDFYNPPYTIVGTESSITESQLNEIYSNIKAPLYKMKPEEAEMVKYTNNNFHALKVTFANEIGNICKELGVDGYKVMEMVAKDTKLNLSSYYLKPGFAFGGSCLPKDIRGLTYKAKLLDVKTPLLNSLLVSNELQIFRGLDLIIDTGKKKIGVLGFAFKAGTDDLRESPLVALIENLIGKGYEVLVYDSNVILSNLLGKNKDYIQEHIPHISKLMKNTKEEVIENSDVIVIGNNSPEFCDITEIVSKEKIIIDLIRINKSKITEDNYIGICW